jgi:hypothetical protein
LITPLLITRLTALITALLVRALAAHTLIFLRRIWHDVSPFLPDSGSPPESALVLDGHSNHWASRPRVCEYPLHRTALM